MLKRLNILLLFVCLMAGQLPLAAQKYGIGVSAGYHRGIQTRNQNDAPFASTRSYSLGGGSSRQLMFHYYPDSSNWYLSAGIQHFSGNAVTAYAGSRADSNDRAMYATVNSFRASAMLTYRFQLRYLDIGLHAGAILPFAGRMEEETWVNDTWGSSTSKARLHNYFSAGFSGGLSATLNLNKHVQFFVRLDLLLMNARIKSSRITAYEDSRGISLEEQYPFEGDRASNYRKAVSEVRNNRDVLPALYNRNQPTDKLSFTRSYSSAGLQFGFTFNL